MKGEKSTKFPSPTIDIAGNDQTSALITQSNRPPVGTERPRPIDLTSMRSQSHKSMHGSITVLPSRSLLIDFREGERRRGHKGDEVLLVSEDSLMVCVRLLQ
jgi:hypothetical protein